VLEGFPKIRRAVLFGSRAIGTFRGASDLDLAIEGDDLNLADLVAVRSRIGRLELPFEADLVIRAKITNSDVEKHIQQYGRVFYERKTTKSNLSGWRETPFSSVIDVKHGFAFPGENIRDTPPGDILLTPGNFAIGGGFKGDKFKYFDGDVPDEYVLNEGDLVVTMTDLSKQADTLGYPAIVPKPGGPRFLHNQRLGKVLIKPGAELDQRFLFYLLRTSQYRNEVLASATGTTVKHTSPGRILAHKASIPRLDEQIAIASVLGALDDKIELNRRMNETLEALAQSLFKSWFVNRTTLPVSRGQTGQSALPKGWRESTIGEEVRVVGGSTPSTTKPEFWEGGKHHWATPKDLSNLNSPVLLETERKITDAGIQQISSGLLPVGTVLLSSRAPIGYLVISEIPVAVNQGFIALICDKTLPNYFVRLWLRNNMEAIEGRANGTTFMEISKTNFRPLPVIVPPPIVLAEFTKQVEPLHCRVVSNLKESRTLAALRDSLLPKLLSGELRVPELKN